MVADHGSLSPFLTYANRPGRKEAAMQVAVEVTDAISPRGLGTRPAHSGLRGIGGHQRKAGDGGKQQYFERHRAYLRTMLL